MQKSRMGTIIHALCYIFLVEPLLSSGFTVASTNSITEPDNLHMRLVGGWNRCSGRVEIYYQDVWGTVCDDIWDIDNAAVVCRQLNCGYASAAHGSAYFGEGSGHIVLDDVRCTGSEQYLWQCPHAGWGYHNCGPHEDASVICSGSHEGTTDIYPVSQTYFSVPSYTGCGGLLMQHSGDITSPFFPSSYPSNARCIWEIRTSPGYIVQLTFQHFNLENSGNNNYCPYDWVAIYDGIPEHSPLLGLICGSGNYTFYSSSNIIGVEFISDNSVEMNGFQAQFTSIYGNSSANYPIRLVGGVDNCSGRVEIYYQNEWGTVCDDGWHIRNAEVVCRQLDCGSPVSALSNAYFGQGFGSIIMDDVNCNGNEQFLSQCPHRGWLSHNCVHSEDAGVICSASIGATSTVRPATPSVQPNITTVPSNTSCGGLLIQHSGVITSPLYPNNYPPNARCTWDIRTNPGYIVKLAFQTFNLESGGSNSYCPYDWVAIYDGIPEYSSLLGKFCGSGNYTFYSSSNIMGVAFRSDSSVQLSGFQAVFTSITSNSSGNYPLRLVGGMDQCAGRVEIYYQNAWGTVCDDGWNIRNADIVCRQLKCGSAVSALSNAYFGPGSGRILLDDVICNGTEQYLWECPHRGWGNHDCSASEDAGVICSASSQSPSWNHTVYTTTTPVYTTTTPVYTTTTPVPSNTSCGGLLIQQSGVITSPSYPNNYPPYARCTWDIRTNPGYIVKLAFQTFNLESGGSNSYCPYDWVAIYDGIPEYSSLLGKFCGSGNYTFYSSSNIMGIEFRSDSSIQLSGFQAVFTSITSNSSGNYPMRLAGGMDQCAGRVEIYYQNAWGTVCDDGWNIRNADIVCRQLKCGSAVSALSNAYFGPGSGRILLDDVICNGTEQYLWECPHRGWGSHDCSASEDAGVICSASSQSPSWNHTVYTTTTPVYTTTTPVPSNTSCGGILIQQSGVITSPSYPNNYPPNARCTWDIRTNPGYIVKLAFQTFNLESGGSNSYCPYDWVAIYDGIPENSSLLGKFCGSGNYTFYSSSNIMGVEFRSDPIIQLSGFQAVFTSITSNSSGNYPMRLAGGMDQCAGRVEIYYQNAWGTVCDDGWNIRNADIVCRQLKCGSAVSALSNAYFGPGSGRILLDDVICNGTEQYLWECPHRGWGNHDCSASEDAGVICSASSQSPSWNHTVYTTTTPVTFNTTWHQWSTTAPNYTCGGILTNPTGLLSSPLYPGYYPNNAYCVWEIRVTPGHQLELTFLQMDLEYANNCVYDSVTIYDGLPLSSPQLDKICISANHTYISNSNIMGIVFRSDSSVQGNGFQAVYTSLQRNNSTPVNCGGILTNPWGIIESPSYPYSHNPAECTWHIQAGSNQVIQISFDDFALENSYSCANAYVAVYDGSPLGSALLGKFCGSYRRNFTSSSNSLSVVYFSRGSNDNFVRGFHSSYVFVTQNNQNVTLTCTTNYMEARISVWYLQSLGFSSSDIFLNDPQCRPQTYGSWLTFYIYYNQCGTLRQGERDTISYSNTINGYNANEIIERSKKLSLNLQCQMYQNSMVEIMYHANDVIQQNLTRYGLYNAGLAFYYNPSFTSPVYQYPYYVQLDQNLYLQATLHSSDPDLILFVDTCVASPSSSDFVTRTYDIIRNGCVRDSTYSTYSSPYPYQARFGFRAFGFLQNYSSVYLQCKLTVCQRYNYNSRCYQGCLARRKRAAEQIHDQITVSLGPFERKN
ncbi:deleted in malignant brain tumors 1 -like [Pelobates cultripes]|uniref:Scavenger receptor cysteine-rich domain-containing protein DMBT1 n=1 Tax=Pelobates cultripes TaxID=61616 RepID=A0AAD1RF73_PELCU|nr:deleted in malignant brain tumors 1 -like [Pelobates cultripes]